MATQIEPAAEQTTDTEPPLPSSGDVGDYEIVDDATTPAADEMSAAAVQAHYTNNALQVGMFAIAGIRAAAEKLARALRHEAQLVLDEPAKKRQAVTRLMAEENPETKKPHSASSAEKIVEFDADYYAHRVLMIGSVVDRQLAWAEYEASRLTAQLRVAAVSAGAVL